MQNFTARVNDRTLGRLDTYTAIVQINPCKDSGHSLVLYSGHIAYMLA